MPIIRVFTYTNGVRTQQSNLLNTETNHWKHLLLNLNLRHVFKNKQEWSIDLDRLYYHNNNPNAYVSTKQDFTTGSRENEQIRISKKTPVRTWVLKTDLIKPLTTKGRLETGLKATTTRLDNTVILNRMMAEGWKIDSFYTQQYQLAEDILAGYVSLSQPLDSKTTLQAGLRYEHTHTDIHRPDGRSLVNRKYGNLFPSVFLSRKLSKNHTANLSYSRRITRPSYDDIAPFVSFVDLNTFSSGNPVLRPTISDAVQGSYTYKDAYVFFDQIQLRSERNCRFSAARRCGHEPYSVLCRKHRPSANRHPNRQSAVAASFLVEKPDQPDGAVAGPDDGVSG